MRAAPPNPHGLTHLATYDNFTVSPRLEVQLSNAGTEFERIDLPRIVGMGGIAHLILYTSARTGEPVTILVLPSLVGDQYAEGYYYFAGMDPVRARAADWITLYDACRALDG